MHFSQILRTTEAFKMTPTTTARAWLHSLRTGIFAEVSGGAGGGRGQGDAGEEATAQTLKKAGSRLNTFTSALFRQDAVSLGRGAGDGDDAFNGKKRRRCRQYV